MLRDTGLHSSPVNVLLPPVTVLSAGCITLYACQIAALEVQGWLVGDFTLGARLGSTFYRADQLYICPAMAI